MLPRTYLSRKYRKVLTLTKAEYGVAAAGCDATTVALFTPAGYQKNTLLTLVSRAQSFIRWILFFFRLLVLRSAFVASHTAAAVLFFTGFIFYYG
jgi:hypothetical protein